MEREKVVCLGKMGRFYYGESSERERERARERERGGKKEGLDLSLEVGFYFVVFGFG